MNIKQQYGFIKAKMIRCKLLHVFLWCHVYGLGNEDVLSRLTEDDAKKMVTPDVKEGMMTTWADSNFLQRMRS